MSGELSTGPVSPASICSLGKDPTRHCPPRCVIAPPPQQKKARSDRRGIGMTMENLQPLLPHTPAARMTAPSTPVIKKPPCPHPSPLGYQPHKPAKARAAVILPLTVSVLRGIARWARLIPGPGSYDTATESQPRSFSFARASSTFPRQRGRAIDQPGFIDCTRALSATLPRSKSAIVLPKHPIRMRQPRHRERRDISGCMSAACEQLIRRRGGIGVIAWVRATKRRPAGPCGADERPLLLACDKWVRPCKPTARYYEPVDKPRLSSVPLTMLHPGRWVFYDPPAHTAQTTDFARAMSFEEFVSNQRRTDILRRHLVAQRTRGPSPAEHRIPDAEVWKGRRAPCIDFSSGPEREDETGGEGEIDGDVLVLDPEWRLMSADTKGLPEFDRQGGRELLVEGRQIWDAFYGDRIEGVPLDGDVLSLRQTDSHGGGVAKDIVAMDRLTSREECVLVPRLYFIGESALRDVFVLRQLGEDDQVDMAGGWRALLRPEFNTNV
ncbi:unnamed protein product [Vitrella brassicaformis CCMP3155]|uniref:Uncharacterized protein n=1 Tax=Vitrella brassicaformis (strain CCMP3155) TaxID=1169540 RepID=A0A0G4G4N6_VITBC|nr:unnamed protein product [Vitrella brassicaformis CCMP3155]|eukprot:CEM23371.1 unnamed protein product [Vitrella brassicaformis CCMP3155]